MLYETFFLLALVTSLVIEVPILIGLVRVVFQNEDLTLTRIFSAGVLCTVVTLPYLWFVLPPYVDAAYFPFVGEAVVVAVEALILNRLLGLAPKTAIICSVIMNAASYGFGLIAF
jgi:hypothetical protein